MNINANLAQRNRCIVTDFFQLKDQGYRSNTAFQQLAEKYYLSALRIRDIVNQRYKWPVEAVTVCNQAGTLSEAAVVDCIIRLPGRPPAMLDRDTAKLYGTKTPRINEQVKRNQSKFPDDFVFQLSDEEFENLRSQNAMSSWGGTRHNPYAFTQYGCNMLATVLKTDVANKRAVQIIRAFTSVEMMIQQGAQVSNSAHPITSKMLMDIYSSLWVMKQGMSDSRGMQHYAATLGTVMDRVYSLLDVSVLG